MLKDLAYAVRTLLRSPGFAIAAVLSLALGLGANTALFSAVDAVLLRPLPYPDPDRLTLVWSSATAHAHVPVSIPDFQAYRDRTHSFDTMAAYYDAVASPNVAVGADEPERLLLGRATHELAAVLRVQPQIGRFFEAGDEQWGRHHVAVLSHRLWMRRFAGDTRVLGQTIKIDGDPWTIVGVMPRGFAFDDPEIDVWTPISFAPGDDALTRNHHYLQVIARVKRGVTSTQAQKDLSGLAETLAREFPENVGMGAVLEPLRDAISGQLRPALLLLLGAVALVLLIACANLANLLLARGTARTREIAVRAALGATRGRIIRQMLAESMLLAVVGGAVGFVAAFWALAGISALGGEALAQLPPLRLDVRVLGFAAALSLLTGLLFGLAPALLLSRHRLADALREAAPSVAPRAGRLRSALVVAEVALSVALLAGAGLLLRSLDRLAHVDPGFDAAHVLTANLRLPVRRYPDTASHVVFLREVTSRVRALPGVSSVGTASQLPLVKPGSAKWITAEGEPEPLSLDAVEDCNFQLVGGDYFAALRMQLVRGRFPDPNEKGIVLNETAARRLFGGKDAVGRRVWLGPPERFLSGVREPFPRYVVTGLVRDVRSRSLVRVPRSEAWLGFEQSDEGLWLLGQEYVIARFAGASGPLAKALHDTVRALDSEQALGDVRTMDERVGAAMAQQRFSTSLLTLFAGLALALAVVGVYAVMAYTVAQRTREIGVRMALGAAAGDVLRLVFAKGFVLVGSGLLIGLFGALATSRAISALLFGISATDPLTYAIAAAVQAAVGALALYLPARRASRLHPAVALRTE